MTAIVGVLCSDGVVIGTDSASTFSTGRSPTIEQPMEKLSIVGERIIVAGTGSVGLGQRFNRIVRIAHEENLFNRADHIEAGMYLCRNALEDLSFTYVATGQYGALVGFPIGNESFLCEFASADFQPEFKDEGLWYVSMGSGQNITDPFLALMRSVFWTDGRPTVQDAIFAVTWALDHAIEVNPGGINGPIRIAVLERSPKPNGAFVAQILEDIELDEHKENIAAAKDRLRTYATGQKPSSDAPDVPKLDAN